MEQPTQQRFLSKDQVRAILQNAPKGTNQGGIVNALVSQGYTLEGFNEPTKVPEKQSLISRIGSDISKRGENINSEITNTQQNPLLSGIKATAEGFGAVTDVAGEIARKIIGDKPIDKVEGVINKGFNAVTDKLANTDLIKGAAMSGEPIKGEQALQAAAGLGQIAGTIDAVGAVPGTIKAVTNTVKSTGIKASNAIEKASNNLLKKTDNQIESSIIQNYSKAVKPTIAGKTSLAKDIKYKSNVIDAVKNIKDNADNISYTNDVGEVITGTPKTIQQFAESIDQTKKSIFKKYDELAKNAGENGVSITTEPIASELDTVIGNKSLAITNPQAIEYAKNLKDRLLASGNIDAQTAQDVIQNYNKSLEAFYKNPTYDNASNAAIDSLVANKFRESLDSGITGLTGEQYGLLKKQYGSLKSIENDVVKAALRDARKNTKGLIDYTDIFSGGQVVNGILSLNPAQIASGLAQKGIAAFYKHLNSPSTAIQKLFNDAKSLK